MQNSYDLVIIGGGPAGASAAIYAARKRLKTLILAESFGGQSVVSTDIQNWIGTVSISGEELASALKKHMEAYADETLVLKEERVNQVQGNNGKFLTITDKGSYESRAVLIAAGSRRRKIEAIGADKFEHKGLTYCASCDGPLFSGQDLVVLGGGNAAFETAAQLLAYAKSVTLINRGPDFYRADSLTVEKVLSHPNMHTIKNAEILEIKGDKFVNGLVYRDNETKETKEVATGGIFVEIGQLPNTEFLGNLVELSKYKQIVIDPRTQKTSLPGIWAAGDCTDIFYHQNNIAVGDAIRALEDIYVTLHTR
ncbi:MAG: FAD-dependent oxidoreductase [Patescibacteria group bacterium]